MPQPRPRELCLMGPSVKSFGGGETLRSIRDTLQGVGSNRKLDKHSWCATVRRTARNSGKSLFQCQSVHNKLYILQTVHLLTVITPTNSCTEENKLIGYCKTPTCFSSGVPSSGGRAIQRHVDPTHPSCYFVFRLVCRIYITLY
jgi:hypothetical protein